VEFIAGNNTILFFHPDLPALQGPLQEKLLCAAGIIMAAVLSERTLYNYRYKAL
jgi:hypothetical protein